MLLAKLGSDLQGYANSKAPKILSFIFINKYPLVYKSSQLTKLHKL